MASAICDRRHEPAGRSALEDSLCARPCGGYYCPPQSSHDWETGTPKSNVKYTPVGWVAQGAVTAAMLAAHRLHRQSDRAGWPGRLFAKFYGWPRWRAEKAVRPRGSGSEWRILDPDFKPYAACRYIHSRLDCVRRAGRANTGSRLRQIERIHSLGPPFVANPDQRDDPHRRRMRSSACLICWRWRRTVFPVDARCQNGPTLLARSGDPPHDGEDRLGDPSAHDRDQARRSAFASSPAPKSSPARQALFRGGDGGARHRRHLPRCSLTDAELLEAKFARQRRDKRLSSRGGEDNWLAQIWRIDQHRRPRPADRAHGPPDASRTVRWEVNARVHRQ